MKKRIIVLSVASVIFAGINAEYLLKQKVGSAVADAMVVQEGPALFEFTSHTFTNCGKLGQYGPTLSECRSTYNTTWDENDDYFSMPTHQGYQTWKVPSSGTYRIEVAGSYSLASYRTNAYSRGAKMRGDFQLSQGEKLIIIAGQLGNLTYSYGGAGGSFVVKENNTPLIIAGGAGGQHNEVTPVISGVKETTGQDGTSGLKGGTNGGAGESSNGTGGAGFNADSLSGHHQSDSAKGFANGLIGSYTVYSYGIGGFGGGGSYGNGTGIAGGGGGYSGGAAGPVGGGGGSYNSGNNQVNESNSHFSTGYITITKL